MFLGEETFVFDSAWLKRIGEPLTPSNLSRRIPVMGNHSPQRVTSDELGHVEYELKIKLTEDGTRTLIEASYDGGVIARGEARRRKGDRRNSNIGRALAMARLFAKLSTLELDYLKRYGH